MSNFVQHVATQPNVVASVNEQMDNLVLVLPNATLANNGLALVVAYPSGASPQISDDKSNTWPVSGAAGTVTADAGGGNMALQFFALSAAATGTRNVTIGFGGNPLQPVRAWLTEVPYTIGTLQGHATATAVNAAGVVSPGAFTPSSNNCLVLSYMSDSNTTGSTNPTLITAASGYALNDADISWNTGAGTPSASQWFAQGTAASTTASFTLTSGGTETYNALSVALSTATPGTQTPAGIHIDRLLYFSTNSTPASWKLQIPSSGNLGFMATGSDLFGTGLISAVDSDSVTWTNQGTVAGPIFLQRINQSASATRTVSLSFTGHTAQNMMMRYYDISGAAFSPFDLTAFLAVTGTNNVGTIANAPNISPTTANGLVIALLFNGLGPTLSAPPPRGRFTMSLITRPPSSPERLRRRRWLYQPPHGAR